MTTPEVKPNSGRKLFFGLFIFPLLIAVGMAVLLCSVVLLTHEQETPESLLAAIKTGSQTKRWQKAFELSNELNKRSAGIRNEGVMKEIIFILQDPAHYDAKTRGYMVIALGHFKQPEATEALEKALKDPDDGVVVYALWSLGILRVEKAAPEVTLFLKSESDDLRKTSAYVLGVIGNTESVPALKPLLEDTVPDVRWNAALSLARLGDPSGLEVLLKMLDRQSLSSLYQMNDKQIETVMINATKGLALIGDKKTEAVLQSIAHSDPNLKVRQAAIDAIHFQSKKEQKGLS